MWHKRINIAVIVLISLLVVSVGLPKLISLRDEALQHRSKNNLKQFGLALHNYVDTHRGLPPGGIFNAARRGYHGWMTSILPYFDASPFFNYVDFNQPWDSTANAGLFLNEIAVYENPSEPKTARHWEFPIAHYCANAHLMAANSFVTLKSIENPSQVFLVGELQGGSLPWGCPYNWRELHGINLTPPTFGRSTRDGCQILFVDGHVQFVANDVSRDILERMNGEDLADFQANQQTIEIPKAFPCPLDALWRTWSYSDGERIELWRDIHGNVKSEVRSRGK